MGPADDLVENSKSLHDLAVKVSALPPQAVGTELS